MPTVPITRRARRRDDGTDDAKSRGCAHRAGPSEKQHARPVELLEGCLGVATLFGAADE
jgi:hypothetical protein